MTFTFDEFNADMFRQPETFMVEIIVGGNKQTTRINTLPAFAKQQFLEFVRQIGGRKEPCKVRFSKTIKIWSEFEGSKGGYKTIEHEAEFKNNAWGDAA